MNLTEQVPLKRGRPFKKHTLPAIIVVIGALRTEAAALRLTTAHVVTGQAKTIGHLRTALLIKAEQIDKLADELSEL